MHEAQDSPHSQNNQAPNTSCAVEKPWTFTIVTQVATGTAYVPSEMSQPCPKEFPST
jgi:hypothetical protein